MARTKRWRTKVLPLCTICIVLWSSSTTAAPDPSQDIPSPHLTIEVNRSTIDAEEIEAWVLREGSAALNKRGTPLPRGSRIVLRIEGQTFDYGISLTLLQDGRKIKEQPDPLTCKCDSTGLIQTTTLALENAAFRLVESQRTRQQTAPETAKPAIDPPQDPGSATTAASVTALSDSSDTTRSTPGSLSSDDSTPGNSRQAIDRTDPSYKYRPSRLGITGLALIGGGALATVIGGALAGSSSTCNTLDCRDFSGPGYILVGTGALILSTGIIMTINDVVRCRRDSRNCGRRPR